MKNLLPVLLCLFVSISMEAQKKYAFTYDNYGNRTLRQEVIIRSGTRKGAADSATVIDKELSYTVKLYPNPVQSNLKLMVEKRDTIFNYQWEVLDASAKILQKGISALNTEKVIDFSSYSSSFYILVVYYDGNKKEYKIIKE